MIDSEGYRHNIAIVLANGKGQLFLAKRIGDDGWQFPQGGVDKNETSEQAMFRELYEEIGLLPNQVSIVARTNKWLCYKLPPRLCNRKGSFCIGQKQHWYLLHLKADESNIDFNKTAEPEFDDWNWVDYWQPVDVIIPFKRKVYQEGLDILCSAHDNLVYEIAK